MSTLGGEILEGCLQSVVRLLSYIEGKGNSIYMGVDISSTDGLILSVSVTSEM